MIQYINEKEFKDNTGYDVVIVSLLANSQFFYDYFRF